MSKMVVVARYNEDVDWCNNLTCDKIIYNKFYQHGNVLPNVGREAHTYLTHIVNNYDNLCDLNIFTQGNPRYHCFNFIKRVNDLSESVDFRGLSDLNFVTNLVGYPHRTHLRVKEYCDVLGLNPPKRWMINANAIFAVNKKLILRNSLYFYKKILDGCYEDEKLPWILERLWRPIFKGNFYVTKMFL